MRSKAKKMKITYGRTKRFKTIIKSDMTLANKTKLFMKIYGKALGNFPVYLALISLSVIFIVPFFYMIGHSVMSVSDLLNPNIKWLPRSISFKNYVNAYRSLDYLKYLSKTVFIVAIAVVAQVMSCSFVAYGIARIQFRLKGLFFALIVFMLIVPPQTIIVPSFIMYVKQFGWENSLLPVIIPCFFSLGLNGGLIVFIFRQFFRGMPAELENAALIDGTGIFGAYFRIIFPNAKPAILTTSILSMVWQWNNSFEPSIYIQDAKKGLLPMQLQQLKGNLNELTSGGVDFNTGINMAATFLTILPIVLIFFALQGRFMKNMANSGLAN